MGQHFTLVLPFYFNRQWFLLQQILLSLFKLQGSIRLGKFFDDLNIQISQNPNTVTANLYLHDESTLIKTEDYGIFEINENNNIWIYTLDTNTLTNLEYSSIVKDTIQYIATDGYFKTIEIKIQVEISGVNLIVNSESINSTQVSYITYFDEKLNSYDTKYNVTQSVTNYEYEVELNNKKRLNNSEIPLLLFDTNENTKYYKYTNILKDIMTNIQNKIIEYIKINKLPPLCPLECVVLLFMIRLIDNGSYSDLLCIVMIHALMK
jgi:VCBS repeat-containing protein